MSKVYVGIDNGVSGTIGVIYPDSSYLLFESPVVECLNYTKAKANITRINHNILKEFLADLSVRYEHIIVILERPMVNPGRFKATISAIRALESTLIALESLDIPYLYIDSRKWQKDLLPSGLKGKELKKGSLEIGNRLFPKYKDFKHSDRDGLLIAEYSRRESL